MWSEKEYFYDSYKCDPYDERTYFGDDSELKKLSRIDSTAYEDTRNEYLKKQLRRIKKFSLDSDGNIVGCSIKCV